MHCDFCGGKIPTTTSMTIKCMCIYLVKTTHNCVVNFVIKQIAKEYDIDHIVAKSIFSVWRSKCKHRFLAWHYYFLKITLFVAISY